MAEAILGLIGAVIKTAICGPSLYKFLAGDKEKRETLWYGMATLMFVIAFK